MRKEIGEESCRFLHMEEGQFAKIQGWFETLDRKIETLDRKFETLDRKVETLDKKVEGMSLEMVTKQQFENRFQLLFNAMINLNHRVENYKAQQDVEIAYLKTRL